ncbi:unnamed protein product [Linum tenue]|uniref:Oleosin n=1 Tax=Linum tenue TaxID=586396 RepID=A0AAV0QQW1_9ROSI|nr:unnamed protein product [Linum tenue]
MATEYHKSTTDVPRPTKPIMVELDSNGPSPPPINKEKGNKSDTTRTTLHSSRGGSATTFLRKAQSSCSQYWNAPTSTQLIGFLTLLISGTFLLFFTGITITIGILTLLFFAPLVIISSPIWIPIGTLLFILVSGSLMLSSCLVAFVAGSSWMYSYFRGMHPPGSDQVDHARSRIVDTATHVKDCAKEYGGYMQNKTNKDVAPGA